MSLVVTTKSIGAIARIVNGKDIKYVSVQYDENRKPTEEVKYMEAEEGRFEYVPFVQPNQRIGIFISGMSGSGKSYSAKYCIDEIRKMRNDPKRAVVFFTSKNIEIDHEKMTFNLHDPAFTKLKYVFPMDIYDCKFLELDVTLFEDCICLFDDFDQLPVKSLQYMKIMEILKSLLEKGRKQKVDMIIITHQTMDYRKTRDIINECDTYILFPKTNPSSAKRFITAYVDKVHTDFINTMRGGQFAKLVIHKSAPAYFLTDKEILLI